MEEILQTSRVEQTTKTKKSYRKRTIEEKKQVFTYISAHNRKMYEDLVVNNKELDARDKAIMMLIWNGIYPLEEVFDLKTSEIKEVTTEHGTNYYIKDRKVEENCYLVVKEAIEEKEVTDYSLLQHKNQKLLITSEYVIRPTVFSVLRTVEKDNRFNRDMLRERLRAYRKNDILPKELKCNALYLGGLLYRTIINVPDLQLKSMKDYLKEVEKLKMGSASHLVNTFKYNQSYYLDNLGEKPPIKFK